VEEMEALEIWLYKTRGAQGETRGLDFLESMD
jgi:hypothetical protein